MNRLRKIISGGQTGADRAALDAAIEMGLAHGGWVSKGRRTEDGPLPERYDVMETESRDYARRTAENVAAADATVLISHGPLAGGSALTREIAEKKGRPWLHLDLERMSRFDAARRVSRWLRQEQVAVLNVAGPRASEDERIYTATRDILVTVLLLMEMDARPPTVLPDPPPADVDQAIAKLTATLTLKDCTALANMGREEIGSLSRLYGFIGRQTGLADENPDLLADCRRRFENQMLTSDDAVDRLVTALWRHLRKTHRLRRIK